MSVKVEVLNLPEVTAALGAVSAAVQAEVAKAVTATALELTGDIQRRVQRGPATGREYTRGNVTHQASAPGEAPATDTGALASSINFAQAGPLTAEVVSRLPYATWLEFGTQKIAPRPSWVPAREAIEPKFQRRVEVAIRKGAGT
jgi:HAMP domain-containing protein